MLSRNSLKLKSLPTFVRKINKAKRECCDYKLPPSLSSVRPTTVSESDLVKPNLRRIGEVAHKSSKKMTSQWRSKVFIRDTDSEQDSQAVFEKVYIQQ